MIGNMPLIVVVWTLVLMLGALVGVLPFWWLWNALVPDLFGLPALAFLQAFGLLILAGLLFGDRLSIKTGFKHD